MVLPYMLLPDEHSSMVDRLCHARLEDKCLKAALKEVLHSQGQDIIKLVLTLIQKPITVHPPEKSFTLKDPPWILLIKGQKHPRIVANTAQSILNPPQLSLASQPILSHKLQLSIQTLLLIWTAGLLKGLPIYISPRVYNNVIIE